MAQSVAASGRLALMSRRYWTPSRGSIVRSPSVQKMLLALADTVVIALSFLVATGVAQGVRGYPMTTEGYVATAVFTVLWLAIVSMFGTYASS